MIVWEDIKMIAFLEKGVEGKTYTESKVYIVKQSLGKLTQAKCETFERWRKDASSLIWQALFIITMQS